MSLNLTKTQMEIIYYNEPEMLIKGVAGGGKTTSLLYNAFRKSEESTNIYFFTYNKVLENYIKDMISTNQVKNIKVATFHKWGIDLLKSLFSGIYILYPNRTNQKKIDSYLESSIDKASKKNNGRFIKKEEYRKFLLEEFSYITTQNIESVEEYIEILRIGRGNKVRLSKNDRLEIFSIYSYYQLEKKKNKSCEFYDVAPILLRNLEKINKKDKMKHIYIDEAQDLDKSQLLLLSKLAQESFYVAADKGQKIYNTSYSWKDIGVNIQGGRTKILDTSYRTTEQILRLASGLQIKDKILKDEDYTEAQLKDMKQGPMPVVRIYEKRDEKTAFINEIKAALTKNDIVGVIVDNWYQSTKYGKFLIEYDITFEEIKGDKGSSLHPGVKITTMHSSKGIEFDHVVMTNFSHEKKVDFEDEDSMNTQRRLYYVALTRARNDVTILVPNDKPSYFFPELDKKHYHLK